MLGAVLFELRRAFFQAHRSLFELFGVAVFKHSAFSLRRPDVPFKLTLLLYLLVPLVVFLLVVGEIRLQAAPGSERERAVLAVYAENAVRLPVRRLHLLHRLWLGVKRGRWRLRRD